MGELLETGAGVEKTHKSYQIGTRHMSSQTKRYWEKSQKREWSWGKNYNRNGIGLLVNTTLPTVSHQAIWKEKNLQKRLLVMQQQ